MLQLLGGDRAGLASMLGGPISTIEQWQIGQLDLILIKGLQLTGN